MITMRMMTGAYLINEDKILMMKRSKEKTLAPDLWAGIGGHVENNEHKNPQESCLREIFEETGITCDEITTKTALYTISAKRK